MHEIYVNNIKLRSSAKYLDEDKELIDKTKKYITICYCYFSNEAYDVDFKNYKCN